MTKIHSSLKFLTAAATGCLLGYSIHLITRDTSGTLIPQSLKHHAEIEIEIPHFNTMMQSRFTPSGFAGNYLAGLHAQRHHDWKNAHRFISHNLKLDEDNTTLLKRAIMLSIAAAEYDKAFERARLLSELEEEESLGQLFLCVEAIKNNDYELAETILAEMQPGGIADFVKPLFQGWLEVVKGNLETDQLKKNAIHLAHGVLMAHYVGDHDKIKRLLAESLLIGGLTINELKRSADIYAQIGEIETAKTLYEQVLQFNAVDQDAIAALKAIENEEEVAQSFISIENPQQGIALVLYDMAKLFYQEGSDDSAHIFAHMALHLDPDHIETYILLAGIAQRNDRGENAIAYFAAVPPTSSYFNEANLEIAKILEDAERYDEAIALLEKQAREFDNKKALIQIGDLHRRQENFAEAIKAYNRAYNDIGAENIIPDFWHLYYVRGIAYERNGEWDKAEPDLKAALDHQPDHAYILNYLGYSWADQGKHLELAEEMIVRALELQPDDGHITDSLGWVLYRNGNFIDAVKYLERAVELLPYDAVINDHLGDAYWQVGRKREARFQWQRAKNHIKNEEELLAQILDKLENGLERLPHALKHDQENSSDTHEPASVHVNNESQSPDYNPSPSETDLPQPGALPNTLSP
ncbi:MAG: tetratricopeptide repeat protein [Alphaproteobacteria bacterium]